MKNKKELKKKEDNVCIRVLGQKRITPVNSPQTKRIKSFSPKKQTVLDFSQRNPGLTKCEICKLTYDPLSKEDVQTHKQFHSDYMKLPKLSLPKDSIVNIESGYYSYYSFVYSAKEDAFFNSLFESCKNDMNMDTSYMKDARYKYFACCSGKKIVGFAVATLLTEKEHVFTVSAESFEKIMLRKENETQAKAGIELLFVNAKYRKKGIAKALCGIVTFVF